MNEKTTPVYILPIIVFAQFAGTSLWFAGNAVISDLQQTYAPDYPNALAELEYLFENMKIVSPERVPDDQATQTDAKSPHETS